MDLNPSQRGIVRTYITSAMDLTQNGKVEIGVRYSKETDPVLISPTQTQTQTL